MDKPKNARVVWATGDDTLEIRVSEQNLESLKEFLSSYVEVSKILGIGDIAISYAEDGLAVINCTCVSKGAVREDLITLLKEAGWTSFAFPDI
jgi:hypothetical protein